MNREDRELEIDLTQLFKMLLGKLKYIVLVTVVFGFLGYVGSSMLITPVYQASAHLIVNTRNPDDKVSNDQLNSAKNLVDTYAVVIRSRNVLNRVITELALPENYDTIAGCVSVKAVDDTQIMQIVVRHTDRAVAFAVAEKLMEIAPEAIANVVGAGSVQPADLIYSGAKPVAPNNKKNAVLAAAIGFVLCCGVILAFFLADNTYKSDTEIQKDLEVPVLGVIPKMESCMKHSKYGYYGYYGYDHSAKEEK